VITASHLLNLLVLLPVCAGLLFRAEKMVAVFGPDTTARQILLSMYLTILVISGLLLLLSAPAAISLTLFGFQIIYKMLSLILIKDRRVPVYWFNGAIALFHAATIWVTLTP